MSHSSRTIKAQGKPIAFTLRKRRGQKRLTLSVHADGRVILTVPKWTTVREAERFVTDKAEWLLSLLVKTPLETDKDVLKRQVHYKKHKEKARTLVEQRLAELNEYYGFAYNRVAIRMNKTRWGSCSSNKNLNFDYRILFLEPHVRDYLLVHELCHLKEMNHSPRFWALVAETVPDHRKRRREIQALSL